MAKAEMGVQDMDLVTLQPPANDIAADMRRDYIVTQFLYREAELLDNRQFTDWLELFDDDVRYQMPVRANVNEDEVRQGFHSGYGGYVFDENKERLTSRVIKLSRGRDVTERPLSLMRRLVTNVQVTNSAENTLEVRYNFLIYRNRTDTRSDTYIGKKTDRLRINDDLSRITIFRREILLDQTLLLGGGIGFLF
ncbi:hypothetical protein CP98_05339 [Sphingobium yanoikuyae]|uniref:Uncharacterized protein n=1 Tax=Sphingobium yanoikuyae TaxID=13690 RepID=A0A084E1W2_SPHYA|nr:aromatic-ring-hydroxylating dioxygenase subunit beta [Sphingobium yanoikuyae]KEZ11954.1 hypothetical protein CP98_05339 [Sphingobium yanoikuyae]